MSEYFYPDALESVRLVTQRLTKEHIPQWVPFFKDKESTRFLPMSSKDPHEMSTLWIEKQLGRYHDHRYGLQALIEKETGSLIGQCGLLAQEVDGKPELEVGYHILPKFRGQGFAPEAARLFIDFAFRNVLTDSVISIIDTQNINSQRVAQKNGLKRISITDWNELRVYIYQIKRKDWK